MALGDRPVRAALDLAARGWSVIPVHTVDPETHRCGCGRTHCPSPGKHPRVRWERWMTARALPSEVEAWWERWPDANIGIVTGWVSGLVVVDIDPRNGGDRSLVALEADHGTLPDSVSSTTGGGGRHVFFAHPPMLVPSRPLAAGIDLKAEGGMVVVPPSRHRSGRWYEWSAGHGPDEHPLAALPGWLDRLALDASTGAGGPPPIPRTPAERSSFAALWAEVGIDVIPDEKSGEVMVVCPFHDDHRPSLHIDPAGCRWFCFGCRRGGGIQGLLRIVHPGAPLARRPSGVQGPEEEPTLAAELQVEVVGESFHQDELLSLTGGRRTWSGARRRTTAELVPDTDNPFDDQAVEVVMDDAPVGHLPRGAARTFRSAIDESIARFGRATCRAEIRGGWERAHGDVGRFGVVVWLPSPE